MKSPLLSSPRNQIVPKFLRNIQLSKLKSNSDLKAEFQKIPAARITKDVSSGAQKLVKA